MQEADDKADFPLSHLVHDSAHKKEDDEQRNAAGNPELHLLCSLDLIGSHLSQLDFLLGDLLLRLLNFYELVSASPVWNENPFPQLNFFQFDPLGVCVTFR